MRYVAVLALVLAACSGGRDEIVVAAASSLTDAFGAIEQVYEDRVPGVDIVLCIALLPFGFVPVPWLPSISSSLSVTALSELIDVREADRFILCSLRNSSCR